MTVRRGRMRPRRTGPGKKALEMVKKLKRTISPEVKVFDAGGQVNIGSSGTVTELFIPSQGDTYINRSGIVVQPKSLQFRCNFAMASAAVNTAFRIILFRGVRESGVAYTTGEILLSAAIDQPLVWLTRDKFTVIADKTFMLNDSGASGGYYNRSFSMKKKTHFTGNGTGVQDGGIYMLLISSEATNTPAFDWHSRVSFTDV